MLVAVGAKTEAALLRNLSSLLKNLTTYMTLISHRRVAVNAVADLDLVGSQSLVVSRVAVVLVVGQSPIHVAKFAVPVENLVLSLVAGPLVPSLVASQTGQLNFCFFF